MLRPYEYVTHDEKGERSTVCPDDPSWSLKGFLASNERGKRIKPVGRHVILCHLPYETKHGSLFLPEGSMERASCDAKVLDVPYEGGKCGYTVVAATLGAKTVDYKKAHDLDARRVFVPIELVPGDIVLCQRFAGTGIEGYGATFGRLRAIDYGEIYGYSTTEKE